MTSRLIFKGISFLLIISSFCCCASSSPKESYKQISGEKQTEAVPLASEVIVGAEQFDLLVQYLESRRIGLVVNHSSLVRDVHLLDTLMNTGHDVRKIFALEHGIRGDEDAGAHIEDSRDVKTGLPIVSLYGTNKKPTPADLKDLDIVLFDIQDVGARFYTYISSLHYIMESAAENGIAVLVADRPNPNGFYVDGPVLQSGFESFVGMHRVPVVHGMTVGEYAKMIKGEKWINAADNLELHVIPCLNYDHTMTYELPVPPSPNLPNLRSVLLYPSLCFFEGTEVSVGRGTGLQFQLIGSPHLEVGDTTFIPRSLPGATNPPFLGEECRGYSFAHLNWSEIAERGQLDLQPLINAYQSFPDGQPFFLRNNFFDRLAGTDMLRKRIQQGWSETQIRAEWQRDLHEFKEIRAKYLLYDDFSD